MNDIALGRGNCSCQSGIHACRLIVVTGGPGAGKTAALNYVRQVLCQHVAILPESASIIFGGGFWRRNTLPCMKGAQLAIFQVQRQLESILMQERLAAVGLCDRGTVDGLGYWPDSETGYWEAVGTTKAQELSRYDAVIHLRTPQLTMGYNHSNPVRIESSELAQEIDQKILNAWRDHPHVTVIDPVESFDLKLAMVLDAVRRLLPQCCQQHA